MPLIEKKYDDPATEFRVARYIRKFDMDVDLTVDAVEYLMGSFHKGVRIQSGTLIVSGACAVVAGRTREEFARLTDIGLGIIVLPDAMLSNQDTWALMNEHRQIVWSPGA
jgi:hypothetical protein